MNKNIALSLKYNKHDSWLKIIKRIRLKLALLNSKYEMLKLELDNIKHEYYFRVGNLMQRDNTLDMDIIMHKKILAYLKSGYTYKQAINKINGEYNTLDEDILEEEFTYSNIAGNNNSGSNGNNKSNGLKQLWKRAVMRFHPDLASDNKEKNERENIMKKINQAYKDHNYELLKEIYDKTKIVSIQNMSDEDYKMLFVDLENKIIEVKKNYELLKKTEWYNWKAKIRVAKKAGIDIFKEMEESLLDDVVKKLRILSELKKEIDIY